MATTTNGICTYNDLKTNKSTYVTVPSTVELTKCPTFFEIENITKAGYIFDPSVNYLANQLVKYSDLRWQSLTTNILYMEALEDGFTFSWKGRANNTTIQYSLDSGSTWINLTCPTNTSFVESSSVNKGSRIYIKASGLVAYAVSGKLLAGIGILQGNKQYKLGGNLRSLLGGSSTLSNYQFANLFRNDTNLIQVSSGLLPFTTLKTQCYYGMFYGCSNLKNAPNLPATTLVSQCYSYIYYGCCNLTYISLMCTTTPSDTYMTYWIGSDEDGLSVLPLYIGIFDINMNAQWIPEDLTLDNPINYGWTVRKVSPPIIQQPSGGGAVS